MFPEDKGPAANLLSTVCLYCICFCMLLHYCNGNHLFWWNSTCTFGIISSSKQPLHTLTFCCCFPRSLALRFVVFFALILRPYICWILCMAARATAHYRQQGATKAKWDWGKLISDLNWTTQICFSFVRQPILQKQNHLPASIRYS